MAVDLQTVLPQDLIPVSSTRLTQLGGFRALELVGEDFRSVDEVRINDMPSPDFLMLSRYRLIAQLPQVLQNNPEVSSVYVLSRTLTVTAKSLLRFRIGDTPGQVQGPLRLLQLFVKLLLSTPGSDVFNRDLGGGALQNVGATFSAGEGQEIKQDFILAVGRVQRQIIGMQSRNGTLPRNERLLRARLLGATFDKGTGSLFINVEVVTQDGNGTRVNLEI